MDGTYVSAFNILQEMRTDDIEIYHYNDSATHNVPPHKHDFYEFYCLLDGSFVFHVDENQYALEPGKILVIQPGQTHWPEFSGPPRDIERIVLWMNPRFIESLSVFLPQSLGTLEQNLPREQLMIPDEKTYRVILGLLYSLLHEKNLADADSRYLCHLILSQLLIHISRVMNRQSDRQDEPGTQYGEIMKVYEYINSHYRESLSVNGLAERFYMDKNTLTRRFKKVIGMTPGDYIRRKRLESAHTLIRQGYGVQQAGYASGFSDYSAFFRAFRQVYGICPSRLATASQANPQKKAAAEQE